MSEGTVTPINTKGFKFSYQAFKNPQAFLEAARKVCTCTNYPDFKSKYRIKRLAEDLEKELKNFYDLQKAIDKTDAEKYKTEMEKLLELEVDIKWGKLSTAEVECIQELSPADIFALEYIAELN